MSKLLIGQRSSLPSATFGLPAARKYPMPDPSHAANAKARASEEVHKGNLSAGQQAQIDEKANTILHKKKKKPVHGMVGRSGSVPGGMDAEDRADGGVDEATEANP